MITESRPSFAFLVLAYNHQDYILEHLESIKYIVLTHSSGIHVDLIINDDCSRDHTRSLIDKWLTINAGLFRHIKTLYNTTNLGTCASVNNMLTHMVADRFKMTAGDDVYSFENIFKLTQHDSDVAMLSGRPLYLLGDELGIDRMANLLATATQAIYQHDSLLHRFKHFSYNNAPNILYATKCLLHPNVRAHLVRFDVTEDWPLQIAIARQFPDHKFQLIDRVLVYYRRTAGSTFIVANKRFTSDKIKIYNDLIQHETSLIERIRLTSRKFCFEQKASWMKKILNLDLYFFSLSYATRLLQILRKNHSLVFCLKEHQKHYSVIKSAAASVRSSLND